MIARLYSNFAFLLLTLFGAWLLVAAGRLPMADAGVSGPAFFPRIIAIGMMVCAILCIVEQCVRASGEKAKMRWRGPEIVAASAIYVQAISTLGYYPATFVYCLYILLRLRDGASIIRVVLEAMGLTLVSYLLFDGIMGAYMPAGTLFE